MIDLKDIQHQKSSSEGINKNTIYNEDCFKTMDNIVNGSIDVILTSPFYNTNKKAYKNTTLKNVKSTGYSHVRYDNFVDNMTNEEYCEFTVNLFNKFNDILNDNGVILYNLSYGSENTEGMFLAIADILRKTNFTIADMIVWKKKSALPNNCSKNKLTRIVEPVFVFCKKQSFKTFNTNKKIKSYRKTGQASFENIFNFIEAKNNDGVCPLNKATYSTELCEYLLNIYATHNALVYDPFIGSGTTAVSCKKLGLDYIGSEISLSQCEWANNRINL